MARLHNRPITSTEQSMVDSQPGIQRAARSVEGWKSSVDGDRESSVEGWKSSVDGDQESSVDGDREEEQSTSRNGARVRADKSKESSCNMREDSQDNIQSRHVHVQASVFRRVQHQHSNNHRL